jgi:hypothetical protein
MKLFKVGEGQTYEAPNHFNYWAIKKLTLISVQKILLWEYRIFCRVVELNCQPLLRKSVFLYQGAVTVKGKTEEYRLERVM